MVVVVVAMNFKEFESSLASPPAAYLVITDQDYLKQRLLESCREQVEDSARAFDWNVFDLKEDGVHAVINCARTMPWMSSRRWIYIRHAEEGEEALAGYLKDPAPRTVLILEASRKSRKWPSLPTIEMGGRFDCSQWLRARAQKQGYSITPQAAETMVELVGDDLQRLDSELEKQILYTGESGGIDVESVMALTLEARDRDIFELIDAIARRNTELAVKILNRLIVAGTSPQQIISMLYWNFRRLLVAQERLKSGEASFSVIKSLKIWTYRGKEREIARYPSHLLEEVLLRLRETDRLCKTTSTNPRIHLERVVIDTCRGGAV